MEHDSPRPAKKKARNILKKRRVIDVDDDFDDDVVVLLSDSIDDFSNSDDVDFEATDDEYDTIIDKGDVIVNGIDPGPVNCGICEYNVTKGEAIRLRTVAFRETYHLDAHGRKAKEYVDLGSAKMIDNIRRYVVENAEVFGDRLTFIEDQDPLIKARGPAGVKKGASTKKEVLAVQFAFQTMLGADKCRPISPHAIKAHFPTVFTRVSGASLTSPEQYYADKKNAVMHGRKEVPHQVRLRYEDEDPKKKDDAFDAYWICKYGAERCINIETGVIEKRGPKKRKKGEKHPRYVRT